MARHPLAKLLKSLFRSQEEPESPLPLRVNTVESVESQEVKNEDAFLKPPSKEEAKGNAAINKLRSKQFKAAFTRYSQAARPYSAATQSSRSHKLPLRMTVKESIEHLDRSPMKENRYSAFQEVKGPIWSASKNECKENLSQVLKNYENFYRKLINDDLGMER